MKMRKRCHGFTLIELLVVCVILIVVAGLFMPGTACGGREKARRTQCLNNLKQIGLASEQYAGDYAGRLPSGAASMFANMTLMSNYLGSAKLLTCPSSGKSPSANFFDAQASEAAQNVSYSYQVSATTGLIWKTSLNDVISWDQGVAGNPGGPNGGIGLAWTPASPHKGAGGNVLFTDGHVAWNIKTPTNMTLGCQNP